MLAAAVCAAGMIQFAHGAEATAYQLIKEGNRYVGEEAKDQVVQIRSEKSVGTMTPNVWYVVFYDPDATFKATEVKFGGGKKLEVKRPMRMLEPMTGNDKKLDRKRMKVPPGKSVCGPPNCETRAAMQTSAIFIFPLTTERCCAAICTSTAWTKLGAANRERESQIGEACRPPVP